MSNESQNSTSPPSSVTGFSYTVRFWLLIIPDTLSILCSIFLLYHYLFNRRLRKALHNHIIIIILLLGLFFELTDVLWTCHYYYFRYTLLQTPAFALIWTFIDYAVYNCQLMLFSLATIERHILVFHDQWLSTAKRRFLIHYLPIAAVLAFYLLYYSILFFVPHCTVTFDYSRLYGLAGVHCVYTTNPVISKFGLFFQGILPILNIIIFSFALAARVLWRQAQLHRSINWRKQRKMIVQLLSIALIYLLISAPYMLLYLAYNLGLSRSVGTQFATYFPFFAYYVPFLFPFVCCLSLPDFSVKFKGLLLCRRQPPVVHPR